MSDLILILLGTLLAIGGAWASLYEKTNKEVQSRQDRLKFKREKKMPK